jgi:hypothetical protein
MKTQTILVALCLITGYLATAPTASAAGYQINDTTAVFFTTFSIDASYGLFGIPLIADHTVSHNDRVNVIGYELTDESESLPKVARVSDIVLSSAPISGLRYEMATGTVAVFTLMSIVTFAESIDTDITSTITKLPFWVDGRRTTVHQNQLDELATAILEQ